MELVVLTVLARHMSGEQYGQLTLLHDFAVLDKSEAEAEGALTTFKEATAAQGLEVILGSTVTVPTSVLKKAIADVPHHG